MALWAALTSHARSQPAHAERPSQRPGQPPRPGGHARIISPTAQRPSTSRPAPTRPNQTHHTGRQAGRSTMRPLDNPAHISATAACTAPPALRGEGPQLGGGEPAPTPWEFVASADYVTTHQRRYPAANGANVPTSRVSPSACPTLLSHVGRSHRRPAAGGTGGRLCLGLGFMSTSATPPARYPAVLTDKATQHFRSPGQRDLRLGFRMLRIERDAFTSADGYAAGLVVDGIPLRDRVWMNLTLGQAA
jgi:hypothetical protein